MDRRTFVKSGGAASAAVLLGGCGGFAGAAGTVAPLRPPVRLAPVHVSWDRIIRTTVGLRPYRASGFRLGAERFDGKTLIHDYGHGGSGMSLSWGTGALAADLALEQPERRAAVIGCGIVGLTAARQLQRRGFVVTIYAASLPPHTTSNMSLAGFTPVSGLVASERRTPAWDATFREAVRIAYREHQLLVGRGYGVSWIDEYTPTNNAGGGGGEGLTAAGSREAAAEGPGPLLPPELELGSVLLNEGEHPFATPYARVTPALRFEPSIYLDALVRDVLAFGGRIVVRTFDTPRDLVALEEPVVVNCTGLGARDLFGDEELEPIKGQLVFLVPQPEVTYTTGSMMPRSDGIALGHVMQRGEWSLEVDQAAVRRVMESHIRLFGGMRG